MQSLFKSLSLCIVMLSSTVYASVLDVPSVYSTIQSAIDASVNGDTVIVSPGTYGKINFGGKNIILTSTNPEDPDIVASTIIDGGANGSVVTFSGSETSACELRGFTITNGYEYNGGGVYGHSTQATIANCTITCNSAIFGGGGGGLYTCGGSITNCIIKNNFASDGGGIYYCDGIISNCSIVNNHAGHYGNGGGLAFCNGIIQNCSVMNNTVYGSGGGLSECNGMISNCVISRNMAYEFDDIGFFGGFGGGLYECNATIVNCTITNWDF